MKGSSRGGGAHQKQEQMKALGGSKRTEDQRCPNVGRHWKRSLLTVTPPQLRAQSSVSASFHPRTSVCWNRAAQSCSAPGACCGQGAGGHTRHGLSEAVAPRRHALGVVADDQIQGYKDPRSFLSLILTITTRWCKVPERVIVCGPPGTGKPD